MAFLLPALLGTGCQSIGYYSQAVRGHLQLISRAERIENILSRTNCPSTLRERLELAMELREFASRELKLPADGHYLKYADLHRPFAVWNVYAAPEFSMKAKTWWYPGVGRLKYRGYFSKQKAQYFADRLREKAFDVHVGGVEAYSTLGWSHDPLLNTFLFEEDSELAEVLFHELAHQRLFISGDTDFNEALATAVAEEGVLRWLASRNDQDGLARYQEDLRRKAQFVELVSHARERLECLYATVTDPDPAARQRKGEILHQLRKEYQHVRETWLGGATYDGWFAGDINNAKLNDVDTYYRLVPAFHLILHRHQGDLDRLFEEGKALAKLKKAERHRRLNRTLLEAEEGDPTTELRSRPCAD